jgi:hypothetical protein
LQRKSNSHAATSNRRGASTRTGRKNNA